MTLDRISNRAADLGGPLKNDLPALGGTANFRAPTAKVGLPKPPPEAGSVVVTRGWLVPALGTAPSAPVSRSVSVPLGGLKASFGGSSSKVTSAELTVPLGQRGGVSVNGVVGTNGGTSAVLGGNVQANMLGDAVSLGADYRLIEPNNGSQTGTRQLGLNAGAQVGTVKLGAAVAVNSPKADGGDRSTRYSVSAQLPLGNSLADSSKLSVNASYTAGATPEKDRYTLTAGVQWPQKGIEVRLDTGSAETRVQVRTRLEF